MDRTLREAGQAEVAMDARWIERRESGRSSASTALAPDMPKWDELPESMKSTWDAVSRSVFGASASLRGRE